MSWQYGRASLLDWDVFFLNGIDVGVDGHVAAAVAADDGLDVGVGGNEKEDERGAEKAKKKKGGGY